MSYKDKVVCFDVETFGLDWKDPTQGVFGVAFLSDSEKFYFDVRKTPEKLGYIEKQFLEADKIVNHNIKFDVHMLTQLGVKIPVEKCECTQIRAALINEHLPRMSLDYLSETYLGKNKENDIYPELAKIFGGDPTRKAQILNLHRAPFELVSKYAIKDVVLAKELWEWQEKEIERQGLQKVWGLEKRLFPVIVKMERGGVRIDEGRAIKSKKELEKILFKTEQELYKIAGFECNYNPSHDISRIFNPQLINNEWVLCDGTIADKTNTGKASIGSNVLKRMTHPAANLILRCRKISKTINTFLDGHILGHVKNGKLHANINQVVGGFGDSTEGTKTGRFSMSRPALQQIPARDADIAAILRPLFLPDEGDEWLSVDYSQFEFRIFAHYVNNTDINRMYSENPRMDFHQLVADLAGIPRNATEAGGPNAKQVNLGVLMGMGEGKMAQEMLLPYTKEMANFDGKEREILIAGEEAKDVIIKYHESIPGVKQMAQSAKRVALNRGYVFTLMGRHVRYPNKSQVYKAPSNIYQGGAADCLKVKLIELDELLTREGKGRILFSVHDEINISIPRGDRDLQEKIVRCMETFDGISCPIELRVPIKSDPGVGLNWAEASGKGIKK